MSTILLAALVSFPSAQAPSNNPDGPAYRVMIAMPYPDPIPKMGLLRSAMIQGAPGLSAAQKTRLSSIGERFASKREDLARVADRAKRRAELLKVWNEFESEFVGVLISEQKIQLEQVQLQLQGLPAFKLDDLPARLGVSAEESRMLRSIAAEGFALMEQASVVPLAPLWKGGKPPSSDEEIREMIKSPAFLASKDRAWDRAAEARGVALGRVEAALNDRQLIAYRGLMGPPFEVNLFWKSFFADEDRLDQDVIAIAGQLNLNQGQRTDPDFDTKIAKPAYAGDRHPSILFDEAHHNFHTSTGRYKVFADLIAHDGYQVTPNRDRFTAKSLAGSDILVIANALGAEGMGHPEAAKSAFTDAECDAVRDWVDAGGSLLLITDHQPFGDAADALAKRFGVDMNKGVASDEANQQERGLLFSREKGLIGDHAITRGRDASERVDRVLTFTGQSLKGPPGSVPFLKFSATAIDRTEDKESSAAGRAQGIAFDRGKGRVVVMGEAAQLSAQVFGLAPTPMGMNVPGSDNRKMALNTMHWLSRLID